MSKTQEKRALRKAQQKEFIKQRRSKELGILMFNFELGKKMFEDNKETLSQEQINELELNMFDQAKYIEEFAIEWELDAAIIKDQVDRIMASEEEQPQDL